MICFGGTNIKRFKAKGLIKFQGKTAAHFCSH